MITSWAAVGVEETKRNLEYNRKSEDNYFCESTEIVWFGYMTRRPETMNLT